MKAKTSKKGVKTGSHFSLPIEVRKVARELIAHKFEAYLVGGCLRDLLLGREPKDWDVATNATPAEVQKIFKDSVYENEFGTVGVKTASDDPKLKIIEVTTYRREGAYTDRRHPDAVAFAKTIEDDLSRRDFTVNALAAAINGDELGEIVDPYHGTADLASKVIRAVGDADARFSEDALRLMRAVRFTVELNFEIEAKTAAAIKKHAGLLEMIAKERVRDELSKMLMAKDAMRGIQLLEDFDLLKHILPELREGIGVGQNLHHIYTVWEHNLRALGYTAEKNYSFLIRLASLLHDVGKPRSKRGEGKYSTFYGHEVIGAKMVPPMLDRLHFSKDLIEAVAHLVRHHLFYYNVGEVTPAGVRRFIARVGVENIDDLIKVREADRIGSGVPKAITYKLRHLLFMIEKVRRDPVSPKMLAVKGDDVMKIAAIQPGPKVGYILGVLLEEVLDDPAKNTKEYLEKQVGELAQKSEKELATIAAKSKERKEEFEADVEADMKKEFYVK